VTETARNSYGALTNTTNRHLLARTGTTTGQDEASMFHVKHSRRLSRGALVAAVIALALVASGCVRIAEPDGWPAPALTEEGLVIVAAGDGEVVGFDPETGREVWRYPMHLPGGVTGTDDRPEMGNVYATPLIDGNALFLVSYEGMVTRIESFDGRIESPWFTLLQDTVVATPVLRDGRLYIATEHGRVVLVDAETGNVEQRYPASQGRVWGRPVLENSAMYLADVDERKTVAIDVGNGARLWEQGLTASSAADLLLDGDVLIVGSFDRALHALDVTANGDERWRFRGDGWFVGPPYINHDTMYAASMRGSVYAIDRDGNELWRHHIEDEEYRASPILTGDVLVVASRDGVITGIDPETGAERWRQNVENVRINAHGLLVESDIFYVTTDHELLRVNTDNGAVQRFTIAR
jgi:outer membrane protein assembly factor BamB